jgi:hypothetical protein
MSDNESVMERFEDWAHLRHRKTSAAQPAAAVTIKATTPGGPVTVFSEAKTIFHDGLEKLESIDEGAIAVVEAIKVNTTAISIANTVASVAHLPDPDGLLAGGDALLKTIATALKRAEQATAPAEDAAPADGAPSFTPAAPVVGGQA